MARQLRSFAEINLQYIVDQRGKRGDPWSEFVHTTARAALHQIRCLKRKAADVDRRKRRKKATDGTAARSATRSND